MRIAIPQWQRRVSPVLDVAGSLLLVDVMDGSEAHRAESPLLAASPLARAGEISRLGINVLICGAISRPLEAALTAAGIRVIAQTCGEVEEVLGAFLSNGLTDSAFLMPGCCGRRNRGRCGGRRRRRNRTQRWNEQDLSAGDSLPDTYDS